MLRRLREPITLTFKGMNNVKDPTLMQPGECPVALNVDFTDSDGVCLRPGLTTITANGSISVYRDGEYTRTAPRHTSYAECGNGWLLWTDGQSIGYLEGNESHPLPVTQGLYDDLTWEERMPVPAGDFICWYSGRIWVLRYEAEVDQSWLYYTDAYDLGTVDASGNWFRWAGRPTMLAAATDGLWVGAGTKVYALVGDTPENMSEKLAAPYAAVARTAVGVDLAKVMGGKTAGEGVVFATTQGICIGGLQGGLTNISENKIAVSQAEVGAAYIREQGGQVHYVVCLHNGTAPHNKYIPPAIEVDNN